jgi:hypothetical protein
LVLIAAKGSIFVASARFRMHEVPATMAALAEVRSPITNDQAEEQPRDITPNAIDRIDEC